VKIYTKNTILAISAPVSPHFYNHNREVLAWGYGPRTPSPAPNFVKKIAQGACRYCTARGNDAYWFLVTGRPARSAAMPVLFLLSGQKFTKKWVFRPAGATRCTDKLEIWHSPCQLSRLSGQRCGNTAPKPVKISNFGQKFVRQGRLVCNIFTKFSAFVRVYR